MELIGYRAGTLACAFFFFFPEILLENKEGYYLLYPLPVSTPSRV
jgi:hypothetical protein